MVDKSSDTLEGLRANIDDIDGKILSLLQDRAHLAEKVAGVKQSEAGSETAVFYRPEREAQVLRALMARNEGPLHDETVAKIFREVMSACLALEAPMKVAYLGPEGTFTHGAALKHFGHAVETVSLSTIDEVFREVQSGVARYGVVPVENSAQGMVNHTLDCFMEYDLNICGEVSARIHHNLLVSPTTKLDNVTRVYAHEQALAQCRKWLDGRYPGIERISVNSNAEAAKRVQGEWNAVAIGPEMAAELYGLSIVAENIEDNPQNTTRFLVVGTDTILPSGSDKTSAIISIRDKPGGLLEVLQPFEAANVSLSRLETRPDTSTGTWGYVFFVDFDGHIEDDNIRSVIEDVKKLSVGVRVLGSYPQAVL